MSSSLIEIAALVLVGALWGCTNPLLRAGSLEAAKGQQQHQDEQPAKDSSSSWAFQLRKFRHVRVWLIMTGE